MDIKLEISGYHFGNVLWEFLYNRLFYCKSGPFVIQNSDTSFKAAYSVTLNIFRKILFSFVKVELSYVFTIKMFSTAENCMEK